MTDVPNLYRSLAAALVDERGWDRAALLATAVRGYVYGSPNPGSYRDEAEGIYKRLGWEEAALLAAWFRDHRNRPGGHPRPHATPGSRTTPCNRPMEAPSTATPGRNP